MSTPLLSAVIQMGKSVAFKNMLSTTREVVDPQIVKMDMDHASLEAFVHFFYTGLVKNDIMDVNADKLLRASHKYGINLLHNLCQEKLVTCIHPDRIFQYFLLGSKCDAEHLVHATINFVANNYNDVSKTYGYEDFLRDDPTLVAKLCSGVFKKLKTKFTDHHKDHQTTCKID